MSYTRCFYHIFFRTKHSMKVLSPAFEKELFQKIWEFCKAKHVFLHRVNGMEEHLHLAVELPAAYSISAFVMEIKAHTALFLKKNPHFPFFKGWAEGYCALSYGKGEMENVIAYIKRQKEHHAECSFHDEIRETLYNAGLLGKEEFFRKDWLE